jgi:hypothetical protein
LRATVSNVKSVAYMNRGKTTPVKRNSGWESTLTERDHCTLRRIVLKNPRTNAAQVMGQQNWIFILKTLFPKKLSDMSFTNQTSMVRLQLLNLWLLKVILRCINDGITTINNCKCTCDMVRWVFLHTVPYIRKSLCLENTQG